MKKFNSRPNQKYKQSNRRGFTLLEIMVSLTLFVIVIILSGNIYLVVQNAYDKNSNLAELNQNARVIIDRISRELRQASAIITVLPPTDADPMNLPPNQIILQDGHNINQITYLRYYLAGSNLMREHKAYYFAGEPAIYIPYNSRDQAGSPPLELVLEDRVIGEYLSELKFWGVGGLINLTIKLTKNQHNLSAGTSIFSRNR